MLLKINLNAVVGELEAIAEMQMDGMQCASKSAAKDALCALGHLAGGTPIESSDVWALIQKEVK